jgi:hypothetical protein
MLASVLRRPWNSRLAKTKRIFGDDLRVDSAPACSGTNPRKANKCTKAPIRDRTRFYISCPYPV